MFHRAHRSVIANLCHSWHTEPSLWARKLYLEELDIGEHTDQPSPVSMLVDCPVMSSRLTPHFKSVLALSPGFRFPAGIVFVHPFSYPWALHTPSRRPRDSGPFWQALVTSLSWVPLLSFVHPTGDPEFLSQAFA